MPDTIYKYSRMSLTNTFFQIPTLKYTLVIGSSHLIFFNFFTIENPIELLTFTISQKNAYNSKTKNNAHPNV